MSAPINGPTRAAYDLKKFRGQQIVQRVGQTRRYEARPAGLKAITALIVLRDKAIKPLLAAAREPRPSRGAQNPTPLDAHYDAIPSRRVGHRWRADIGAGLIGPTPRPVRGLNR